MKPNDALQPSLLPTPFEELNDVEKKERVNKVIQEARKMADEVGMSADYRSLVSQLEIELDITSIEAATWLEAVGISPEEGQELEGREEEPLPRNMPGFERLFAALAELPLEEEGLDDEDEALPTPPTDPALKPSRNLSRFDRLKK